MSLIFACSNSPQDTLKAYLTLSRFFSTKQIRHLGISNCYDPLLLQWLIDSVAEYSSKHQEEPEVKVGIVQNRWYEGNGWDWDGKLLFIVTSSYPFPLLLARRSS